MILPNPDGRLVAQLGIVLSFVLMAGGVLMASRAPGLRILVANGPGSGFLPFVVGSSLAVVALFFLLQNVAALRNATGSTAPDADEFLGQPPEAGLPRAVAIVATLLLLAATLEHLGFQLSMFAFLLFHLKVLGRRGWVMTLLVAALGSFGTFALFAGLLQVSLPRAGFTSLSTWGL